MGSDARLHEVCVVGAGPAGCIAAILLARAGRRVALVGDQSRPAKSQCELVAHGAEQQLGFLELAEALEGSLVGDASRKSVLWGPGAPVVLESAGALIDRALFDRHLRRLARRNGVEIIDTASRVSASSAGAEGWRIRGGQDPSLQLTTGILIDSTGQGSRFSGPQERVGPPLLAITARARDGALPPNRMFVEALETGWLWLATAGDDTVTVSTFCDPRMTEMSDPAALLGSMLRRSLLVGRELGGLDFRAPVALNASTYVHSQCATPTGVVIGDASFSRDPLLSHGLHWAIRSAISGAAAVNTILACPARTGAAITYHQRRQGEAMQTAADACASFYAEGFQRLGSPFWAERASDRTPPPAPPADRAPRKIVGPLVQFCRNTRFEAEPVLRDGMIEEVAALCHPSFDRPIAFVENVPIEEILPIDPTPFHCRRLTERIAGKIGPESALQLVDLLIQTGAIVQAYESCNLDISPPECMPHS